MNRRSVLIGYPNVKSSYPTKSTMKFASILVFVFALIAHGLAVEVKTSLLKVGNMEYQDVTVTLESRFRAKMIHSSGVSRVATSDLPEKIKRELNLITDAPTPKPSFVLISQTKDSKELNTLFKEVEENEGWNAESTVTVRQTIGIEKLVDIDLSSEPIMLVGDNADRADGATFKALVQDSGRTYEYTTVLGANKKVRIYTIQAPITATTFRNRVKCGTTYQLKKFDQIVQCPVCHGNPIPCQECDNKGLITEERVVQIRWD